MTFKVDAANPERALVEAGKCLYVNSNSDVIHTGGHPTPTYQPAFIDIEPHSAAKIIEEHKRS
jgi:hypothetical protein